MIRVVKNHVPAGVSIRTLAHFGQNAARDRNFSELICPINMSENMICWNNGREHIYLKGPQFNKYDYGWIGNSKRYGTIYPPAYDLSKVTVPVYIFHAANDYLATPKVFVIIANYYMFISNCLIIVTLTLSIR